MVPHQNLSELGGTKLLIRVLLICQIIRYLHQQVCLSKEISSPKVPNMGDLLFSLYGAVFLTAHYVDSSTRKLFSVGVQATHKFQDAYDRKAAGRISSPYTAPSTILEPYVYEPLYGPSKI